MTNDKDRKMISALKVDDAEVKQAIMLSFLSNVSSSFEGTREQIATRSKTLITDTLAGEQVNALMDGNWDIVWGPGIYMETVPFEILYDKIPQIERKNVADHMMFVAKRPNPDEIDEETYVISISGTNGVASFFDDWITHNLNISQQTWPFGDKYDPKYKISAGALVGINHLLSTTSTFNKGNGSTLLGFLANLVEQSVAGGKKKIHICTTGHSMGGALSPALALYLLDERRRWNDDQIDFDIACVSLAGYSIANPALAKRLTRLGNEKHSGFKVMRIYNPYDVAPYVWSSRDMVHIPFMYGRPYDALMLSLKDLFLAILKPGPVLLEPIRQWITKTIAEWLKNLAISGLPGWLYDGLKPLMKVEYDHITAGVRLSGIERNPNKLSNEEILAKLGEVALYHHVPAYIDRIFGKSGPLRNEINHLIGALGFGGDFQAMETIVEMTKQASSKILLNPVSR